MDVHSQLLEHVTKHGIVRRAPLNELGDSVAIDANSWFSNLLDPEPKSTAVGMHPRKAAKTIMYSLQDLRDAGIRVVMVFEGINLSLKEPLNSSKLADKGVRRAKMWEKYADVAAESLTSEFNQSLSEDFVNELVVLLRADGIECIRAPYQAQAQCASLVAKESVGSVLGRLDLLIYDVSRVVVRFDCSHFSYVVLQDLFKRFAFNMQRLRITFMKSGYWFSIEKERLTKLFDAFMPTENPQILNAIELVKAAPRLEIGKPNRLRINRAANLSKYLGLRLPDALYSAVLLSFVSTKGLSSLCSGEMLELPPLADSKFFRRCLVNVESYRYRSLKLLCEQLPAVFSELQVKLVYWFNEKKPKLISGTFTKLNWTYSCSDLATELRRQNKQCPDLQFALKWHCDSYYSNWPLTASYRREEAKATTVDEAIGRTLLRFLQQIDFINVQGRPMLFGGLLIRSPAAFQQSTLILLELFRQGLLTGQTIPQHKSNPINERKFEVLVAYPPEVPESQRTSINLLARVLMLLPATVAEDAWTGPIDYSLLQFYSVVRLISKSFRFVLESEITSQFLQGKVSAVQLMEATPKLPFFKEQGLVLGLLVKHAMLRDNDTLADLQGAFPQLTDIRSDLKRAWEFWGTVMEIARTMLGYQVMKKPTYELFNEASIAFKLRLIRLDIS
jgi:hypothetical protein